jgi:hypothetical protein
LKRDKNRKRSHLKRKQEWLKPVEKKFRVGVGPPALLALLSALALTLLLLTLELDTGLKNKNIGKINWHDMI